jgi:hypothetical protein
MGVHTAAVTDIKPLPLVTEIQLEDTIHAGAHRFTCTDAISLYNA